MPDLRFVAFFAVVVLLSLSIHVGLGMRLLGPMALEGRLHRLAWAAVVASGLAIPGTFLLLPASGHRVADLLQWLGYLWMGLFALAAVLLMARELGWLVLHGIDQIVAREVLPFDPERRRLLAAGLNGAVLGASALVGAGAWWKTRALAEVVTVPIPIAGLPDALVGFRIAQISDLHVGPTVRAPLIRALVERVNALKPDLVALTGDLIDGPVNRLAEHVAPLGELASQHGTWFVTGNHEYYSGADAWCAHVREVLGMHVLLDEHRLVQHGSASVLLAGITDRSGAMLHPTHASDLNQATAGAPDSDVRILLAHQPEAAPLANELGFHLQLSGHTHGGQFVPFTWLIRLVKRWVKGLYRHGNLWVYVNPGTTWWGPPMRLGSPQEITLLQLERA